MRTKVNLLAFRLPYIALMTALLFPAAPCIAGDLYNCDGKWTNKPCEGEASAKISTEDRSLSKGGTVIKSKPQEAKTKPAAKEEEKKEAAADDSEQEQVDEKKSEDEAKQRAVKAAVVTAFRDANRACKNYYNYSDVRSLERICNDPSTSADDCYKEWEGRYSVMLANIKEEACREKVFDAINRVDALR